MVLPVLTGYDEIKNFIEKNYKNSFSLHKHTRDIYLDGKLFEFRDFRHQVTEKYNVLLENDKYIDELTYIASKKNVFSPIEDYLNECVEKYPNTDYNTVFRDIATHALHINPDSLEAKYVAKTLVGAVKRIFDAGCQFDTVLVLKGKQGYFKTSFFRELAGKDNFDSMSLNFGYNVKDDLMTCNSKWILELGECESSIKPHTLGKLKQFITKTSDTYRKPYAKTPVTMDRQFILVGSTNEDEFLQDATGNRRFWIVDINEKINIDWVKENRDLIWSASVYAYLDNYAVYLSDIEQEYSNKLNEKYQQTDLWEETIYKWLCEQKKPFTLTDVLKDAIKLQDKELNKRSYQTRVKSILIKFGLTAPTKTTCINGTRGKFYNREEFNAITTDNLLEVVNENNVIVEEISTDFTELDKDDKLTDVVLV